MFYLTALRASKSVVLNQTEINRTLGEAGHLIRNKNNLEVSEQTQERLESHYNIAESLTAPM